MKTNKNFEELFLSKEEEVLYKAEKLEKKFILPKKEMLRILKETASYYKDLAKISMAAYLKYKKRINKK